MKRRAWLAGALALSITVTAMAAGADGQEGATTAAGSKPAVTTTAGVDPTHRQALESLAQERQAFVAAFDWNRGERQVLRKEYARTMDAFTKREMELKKALFLATGRTEEAARLQASLDRMASPQRNLPQVAEHPAPNTEAGK